jgi:DNA replication and repair protein RecF
LSFCEKINCFTGDNGVGKTNILDAIHYLSLTKSFFNPIDSQNIKHGHDFFVLQGSYELNNEETEIYCGFKKNKKKQFSKNKKEYSRFADHIGLLPVVMITPSDISLITDSGEERRKFMNSIISQYDREYLECLIRYNKALANRNKLLKQFQETGNFNREYLDIYDEQLIMNGTVIYEKRLDFIKKIAPFFQKYYDFISLGREQVKIKYRTDLESEQYSELIRSRLAKDRTTGYTTCGVHRDDLEFLLTDFPIKKIGSQGQQKTYLVALKMAKFEFINSSINYNPILLLDDIFDKFDEQRVKKILELVSSKEFGQIFITDTSKGRMKNLMKETKMQFKIFNISENGIQTL